MMLNRIFDYLWIPLSAIPAYFAILIIAAFSAVLFLIIFKKTSNQEKIKVYKNRITGYILEIRLYKDQPRVTIKNILNILGCNLVYLRYALVPLIFIILPVLIISVQLNNRYGYLPVQAEKPFIVRVDLDRNALADVPEGVESVECTASDGIVLETLPMRISSDATIFWRAKVVSSDTPVQTLTMTLNGGDETVTKKVVSAMTVSGIAPETTKWCLESLFANNAEKFIPEASPFKTVSVDYQKARYAFLFWSTDPVILYFIWTLIFSLVFKRFLKVTL